MRAWSGPACRSPDPFGGFLSRDAIGVPVEQRQVQIALNQSGRLIGQMHCDMLQRVREALRHRNLLTILIVATGGPGTGLPPSSGSVANFR